MPGLRSNRMRHRIEILEKSVTQNATGEEVITWNGFGDYWASVEPIRGREFTEMRQAQAEISTRIRMRYTEVILPTMRVRYDGRNFEIVSIIHVNEQQRELQLMCSERIEY
jgi:SPP1 family predicted phage head-tail adaptor